MYGLVRPQQRAHFYDLTSTFDQTNESLFLDWCHITMTGNELIARKMFEAIRPSGS
jgi:hypothetical protein